LALLLVVICFLLHIRYAPFLHDTSDVLEFVSLFISFLTFFFGLFLYSSELQDYARVGISIAIVGLNLFFVVYSGYLIMRASVEYFHDRVAGAKLDELEQLEAEKIAAAKAIPTTIEMSDEKLANAADGSFSLVVLDNQLVSPTPTEVEMSSQGKGSKPAAAKQIEGVQGGSNGTLVGSVMPSADNKSVQVTTPSSVSLIQSQSTSASKTTKTGSVTKKKRASDSSKVTVKPAPVTAQHAQLPALINPNLSVSDQFFRAVELVPAVVASTSPQTSSVVIAEHSSAPGEVFVHTTPAVMDLRTPTSSNASAAADTVSAVSSPTVPAALPARALQRLKSVSSPPTVQAPLELKKPDSGVDLRQVASPEPVSLPARALQRLKSTSINASPSVPTALPSVSSPIAAPAPPPPPPPPSGPSQPTPGVPSTPPADAAAAALPPSALRRLQKAKAAISSNKAS
jgi:hypothetical protein